MKNNALIITNLVILAVGILFLAASRQANFLQIMIYFMGVLFIIPGFVNAIDLSRDAKRKPGEKHYNASRRILNWVVSCGAIILGLSMCFFPHFFKGIVVFIFGVCLVLGGIYHIYMLGGGLRPVTSPWWLFLLPILLIADGVWLFLGDMADNSRQHLAFLFAGIGLLIFAVTSFAEMICIAVYNHRLSHKSSSTATPIDEDHRIDNE